MVSEIRTADYEGTDNSPKPVVCLGMPLYNQTKYLAEALTSLLAQTYSNFKLVISDDSTEPGPGRIVKSFADRDQRIAYHKNESRQGLVDNWRTCLQLAGKADYFAWVGDHDKWHPDWLESLVRVLNSQANVQLVYSNTVIIDENSHAVTKNLHMGFSSLGLNEKERIEAICLHAKGFGNMVYGLFRTEALRRAGVFRKLIMPDVILLLEVAMQGDICPVDRELWYRRDVSNFNIARQKKTLFVKRPWYSFLPWPIVNACSLFWNIAVRSENTSWQRIVLGLKLAIMYLQRWLRKLGQDSWIGSYNQWRSKKWRAKKLPWLKKNSRR